jgi:alanyl-tRNA synthetase
MSDEEVRRVTNQVQEAILANLPVEITLKPLDEAKGEGAMALFGEKYGEIVRTVRIPDDQGPGGRFSYELCGGTHVASTGEIGPFMITKEESSSAGVRRIVAVTGHAAQQLINRRLETLDQVASLTQSAPETVEEKVTELLDSLDAAHQALTSLEQEQAQSSVEDLLAEAVEIGDSKVLISQVAATDDEMLGWMADRLREHMTSGAVVLGGEIDGKARLVVKVTPDLVKRGLHAGNLIKAIAKVVEGGGGGRPDFASAGGKNPAKLPEAIARAKELIDEALS